MGKSYNNNLFKSLISLQSDLKDKKINNEEFNILIGFLLQQQMTSFIDTELRYMMPKSADSFSQVNLLNYQKDTNITHA